MREAQMSIERSSVLNLSNSYMRRHQASERLFVYAHRAM